MKVFSAVLVAAAAAACANATASKYPTIATSWTAVVTSAVDINEGGQPGPNGQTCCSPETPQCKVQTEFQAARQYVDAVNNRVKVAGPNGAGVVYDYKTLKAYEVDSTGKCTGFCPIPKKDAGISPLSVFNMTDKGTPTNKFCTGCEDYFSQQLLFNISMQSTNFYVNQKDFTDAQPVAIYQLLTPFGEPLGSQTQTFQQWVSGVPSASVFNVIDAAKCPEAQCNSGDGDGDSDSDSDGGDGGRRHRSVSALTKQLLTFPSVPAGHPMTLRFINGDVGLTPMERLANHIESAVDGAVLDYLSTLPSNHAVRVLAEAAVAA